MPEELKDTFNLVKCDKCKAKYPEGCHATKELFLKRPPPALVIQLKRFKSKGYSLSKSSRVVRPIETIYLDDYVVVDRTPLNDIDSLHP